METKIDRIRSNWTINDQCGLNRINIDRIGLKWTKQDQSGQNRPNSTEWDKIGPKYTTKI